MTDNPFGRVIDRIQSLILPTLMSLETIIEHLIFPAFMVLDNFPRIVNVSCGGGIPSWDLCGTQDAELKVGGPDGTLGVNVPAPRCPERGLGGLGSKLLGNAALLTNSESAASSGADISYFHHRGTCCGDSFDRQKGRRARLNERRIVENV
jgi:hypothetical protein